MKRTTSPRPRLPLAREALRPLTAPELRTVVGATWGGPITSCGQRFSDAPPCPTFDGD